MTIKAALLGLGTVGSGVYRAIQSHQQPLQSVLGERVEVVAILVKDKIKRRALASNITVTTEIQDILSIPDLDVAVEAIVGGDPAKTYITQLLEKRIHVVSANKELIAHEGKALADVAESNGVRFSYEAAVAGGIPVIRTIQQLLRINRIEKIEAILNGTSNYILTEMRNHGLSFNEALANAQREGYAEADPTNDIEGRDGFYKLMILSQLVFGRQPVWEKVERIGISQLKQDDLLQAQKENKRVKLVASLERVHETIIASIKPAEVDGGNPLYSIEGVDNAVRIQTDLAGDLLLRGPGAGANPAASAIIEDLADILEGAAISRERLQVVR